MDVILVKAVLGSQQELRSNGHIRQRREHGVLIVDFVDRVDGFDGFGLELIVRDEFVEGITLLIDLCH